MRTKVRQRASCGWAGAAAVLLLAGCASAPPVAVRPTANLPPPPAPSSPPVSPPLRPATASMAPASATPVASAKVVLAPLAGTAGGPAIPVPPAVPPGVAARFPEPAMTFATPAFEAGRQAFTTPEELRAILAGLERDADTGAGAGSATRAAVLELGRSQAGLPIAAIAFTRPAGAEAAAPAGGSAVPSLAPARRPTVLVIAGQHGDEPAGTEALVVMAQEIAAGRLDAVLASVDVVLVPRANPDGASGFRRETADGTDLDADHLLLNTPEAQALARLQNEVQPVVVLDLHEYAVGGAFSEKFGALQRADAQLGYATTANMAPFVTRAAEEWFRLPLIASLRAAGLSGDWAATTSADPADRRVSMAGVGPQIGRNAAGLRHAVSLLVETRGGGLGRADLKRRVQAQLVAVRSVLASAAAHAGDLAKLRTFVERDVAAKACQGEAVIDAAPTPSEYGLAALDRETGAIRRIEVAWESSLVLRVLKARPRPCGYWLAAGETEAVRHLRLLGIDVQQLDEGAELRGESYRETARQTVQTVPALLDIAAGGYYVPLDQPLANLAIAALEPESPAGFVANRLITGAGSVARILQRPAARATNVP